MDLTHARRIAEIVNRMDELKVELGKLMLRPDVAKRVSAKVEANLVFARALRGLPSTARKQIVRVKKSAGPQAALQEAEKLRAQAN